MNDLPDGWAAIGLGEIAAFEMGQAPPGTSCNKDGHGTVFVKAGEFGVEYPIVREWTTEPLKFAKQGDVLICVVGATSGKLNLGIDCAIGRSVAAIQPSPAVNQMVLYRQLQLQVKKLRAASSGSAQGVISKQMLAEIRVVVPPAREQTRIADRLDALLARIQACNDRLDAVPALLKRLRRAVVSAGIAGELTEDWRATGEAPKWAPTELQAVCRAGQVITYGVVKLGDEVPDGTPCLRTSNVRWLRFENDGIKRIARELSAQYRRTVLSGDEVLVNVRGTLAW